MKQHLIVSLVNSKTGGKRVLDAMTALVCMFIGLLYVLSKKNILTDEDIVEIVETAKYT